MMWILSIGLWLTCFALDKGSGVGYSCRGGGGDDAPTTAKVDPAEQARANLQAQQEALPGAAKVQFDILSNPEFGLMAQSQLSEDVRRGVFGQESAVRDQLLQNVLANLVSPTGITQGQQQAIDTRRGESRGELTEALRTRANLGGGLFGGRAAGKEAEELAGLENLFAEEDIAREERARLNAIQAALPALQTLFPQAGLSTPQFINPVVGANTQYQGAVNQSNLDANLLAQQQANQAGLQSALFGALGTGIGGALGGPLGGALGGKLFEQAAGGTD